METCSKKEGNQSHKSHKRDVVVANEGKDEGDAEETEENVGEEVN